MKELGTAKFWLDVLSEMLATTIFMFGIVGLGINTWQTEDSLMKNALFTPFNIVALSEAFDGVSCFMNPSVTLAFLVLREISLLKGKNINVAM